MFKKVVLLEDDLPLAQSLAQEFTDHGYTVSICQSLKDMKLEKYDYAVIDLRLGSGEFGLEVIAELKKISPDCRIITLSGYTSITTAVEAIKRGAIDCLTKPASFQLIEAALLGQRTEMELPLAPLSLSQVEHEYIDFMLTQNQGNISKTAQALGIHRQSLQRKLKKYI